MTFRSKASSAFTLVEMLVILAVIIVLVMLIIPATKSVYEKSQEAACMAHLRTIGVGAALYAGDEGKGDWIYYDDLSIPPENRQGTWSSPVIWDNVYSAYTGVGKVYPYINDKSAFICPKDLNRKEINSQYPEWGPKAKANIYSSYVARGSGQTLKNTTGDIKQRLGKKSNKVARRAIVSCYFMQYPPQPTKPLSFHNKKWPILFGDGSVRLVRGAPDGIDETTDVWSSTRKQIDFWDHADEFY